MVTSAGSTASSLALKFSRLNHFSFRLRPAVSIPLCLTFAITPASPRFSFRWLACLAGAGFSPAGIRDLARPHRPDSSIVSVFPFRAKRPCEAAGQDTAVQVTAKPPLDVGRHRSAIPVAFAAPAQIGLEVRLYHPIEYCLGGTPRAVWGWDTSLC